ncbi:MAG: hypothetical protein HC920_00200 [Oscillatoriales cyanobacterium SM2_3_0]|nr:hypothetical protein [Oscillatoriales cyanobacterium SM2_3_0]
MIRYRILLRVRSHKPFTSATVAFDSSEFLRLTGGTAVSAVCQQQNVYTPEF